MARQGGSRKQKKLLIVCEGEATEVHYFNGLKAEKHIDLKVFGTGKHPVKLAKKAVYEFNKAKYSECWTVFDRDDFKEKDIKDAMNLAYGNGIKVAFSNEAFELWLLLHFREIEKFIPRDAFEALLTQEMKMPYKKNLENIYELTKKGQAKAISRAKKISSCGNHLKNPYSTVYKLVERLLELKKL